MKEDYQSAGVFPWKVVWQHPVRDGKIVPSHFQLCPTNKCNSSCSFCSVRDRDKSLEIPFAEIERIVYEAAIAGAQAVTITGGGEPLVYREINQIISLCASLGIKVGLTTNGISLQRLEYHDNLVWCRVSKGDGCKTNIPVIEAAMRVNKHTTWGMSYVKTSDLNMDNLNKIIDFVNRSPIDHIRITHDINETVEGREMPGIADIKTNKKVILQDREEYKRGSKKCWLSLLKPYICPEGLYPCCGSQYSMNGKPYKNIDEMRFGELKDMLKIFLAGVPFDGSRCDVCYYSAYNDLLDSMINKPKHKEFL